MIDRIIKYASLDGVSGDEQRIREAIIQQVKAYCSYEIDPLGNLICFKKGMVTPQKRLMITAHMDEVGFIITGITQDGLLKFAPVGGIRASVIIGRAVRLSRTGHTGIIGTKAVHQQTVKERETVVPVEDLFIDIGANTKQQAEELIEMGDRAVFLTTCEQFGDGYLKGKALDNRIGCAILIEMIQTKLKFDTYFAFVTQEEVGMRGARAAAYQIRPDVAIVVETTTAADLSNIPDHKQVCALGKGAVISFMDRATVYDRELFDLAKKLAVSKKITAQTKNAIAGGNDSGAIHLSRGGVRTIAVSVPCRYLHSGVCVARYHDIVSVAKLTHELAEQLL